MIKVPQAPHFFLICEADFCGNGSIQHNVGYWSYRIISYFFLDSVNFLSPLFFY